MPGRQPQEGIERRVKPRRRISGTVLVRSRETGAAAIPLRLVNISDSGFRAHHNIQTLPPGQEMEFSYNGTSGRARVIWTRVVGAKAESGFLVLPATG